MPQLFHPSTNTLSKLSIFGGVFILAVLGWVLMVVARSPYMTNAGIVRAQSVPFSHQHHVGKLGIDCRYCHTGVEDSSFAGIPPTKTCMNCHSQIWVGSSMLEPVRESYRTNKPLRWERVHRLQEFAYFDHSVHIRKGVGCVSCHGRVDQMPLLYQENSLLMEWCLDCHREPEKFVRPRSLVFSMTWKAGDEQPATDQKSLGKKLVAEYGIQSLTSCSTCHR